MDKIARGIAAGGDFRVVAAITTETVTEAVRRHKTSPTVAAALGRTMTAALLLAASLKESDRLTLRIEGDGPAGTIIAEATASGTVRGYVANPFAELPPKADGKFDVGGIVGKGMLHVIREIGTDLSVPLEPYVGSVPLVSGEIAEDVAYYLLTSEQIPSAVLLGVLLQNTEPFVKASGGVMIQMMPGANEHLITMIEDTIANAPHLTSIIDENTAPADLLRHSLGEIGFEILEEKAVRFECNCSIERANSMLVSLGPDEVAAMIAEDDGAVITCGFCGERYEISGEKLRNLIDSAET